MKIGLSWNSDWVKDYETPLSIFGKFIYANNIDTATFFELFGNLKSASKTRKIYSQEERSLVELSSIDGNKFERILGVNVVKYNNNMIKKVARVGFNGKNINSTLRSRITYCPKCREVGYHSYFHQTHLFDYCVFHPEEKLLDVCPSCSKDTNPYLIADYGAINFCTCGHPFFNESRVNPLFNRWRNPVEINCDKALQWVKISPKKMNNMNYFILDLPESLEEKRQHYLPNEPSLVELLLCSLGAKSNMITSEFIKAKQLAVTPEMDAVAINRYIDHMQDEHRGLSANKIRTEPYIRFTVYEDCFQLIHSLSAKYRNAENHSNCCKSFTVSNIKLQYCDFELAFRLWWLELCGSLNNLHITNDYYDKFDPSKKEFQFPFKTEIELLLDSILNNPVNQYIENNIPTCRFIIENVARFLLNDRFIQWQLAVKQGLKLSNNLTYKPRSNYLLCIPNQLQGSVSFHSKKSLERELESICSSDNHHHELSKEVVAPTCELEYVLNLIDAHNFKIKR